MDAAINSLMQQYQYTQEKIMNKDLMQQAKLERDVFWVWKSFKLRVSVSKSILNK